jgi:hypothetical protein
MALDLQAPGKQTLDFPAAASATNKSNSIFIPGWMEVIGYMQSAAMEAGSDHFEVQVSRDAWSVADADASWVDIQHQDKTAEEYPCSAAAAQGYHFDRANAFVGPARIRLAAVSAAHAAVNQDGQIIYPMFRDLRF